MLPVKLNVRGTPSGTIRGIKRSLNRIMRFTKPKGPVLTLGVRRGIILKMNGESL